MAGYQLAQAYVQIVPSMKGVGRAIESAFAGPSKSVGAKAGQTAGGGFSSGFAGRMGAISGVASSIASKVIGVFGGLSSQILDASDSTQKFGQTLQFAGVSDKDIKRLTASTQDYANKTVYGIDDIRNTTAQLAANGVPNYDKLAEAAGNLNAVAGGNAETYKSVAMMLTQTAGAGKLTTENWNQLADAIPGASGKLQEAMKKNGAYTGNFRDAMEKGEISSEEFNKALMQLGMTDVAKQAAESTSTFEGAFGNLQATIVDKSAQILETVKPALTGAITAVANGAGAALDWVDGAIRNVIGWFKNLYGQLRDNGAIATFRQVWDQLKNAVSGIMQSLPDFSKLIPPQTAAGAIKLVADALNTIIQAAPKVAPVVLPAVTAFLGFKGVTAGVGAVAKGLDGVFAAATGVKNVAGMVTSAFNGIGGVGAVVKNLASNFKLVQSASTLAKNAQLAWNQITTAGRAVATAFGASARGIGSAIGSLTSKLWASITALARSAASWVAQTAAMIASKAAMIASKVATAAATAAQWLLNAAMNANPIMLVVTAIAALVAGLVWFFTQTEAGRQLWATFTAGLQSLWQGVTDFFQRTWQSITRWFTDAGTSIQNAWNALVAWFQGVPGRIQGFFASIGAWFVAKFNEAKTGIVTAFTNAVNWVRGVPGRITGFFASIGAWFTSKFNEAKTGIVNAFTNAVNWVRSVPGRITAMFINIGVWFVGKFNQVRAGIVNAFTNAVNWVRGVPGRIQGFFASISAWFTGKFNEVRNGIANGFNSAVSFVAGIPGRILGALGNLGGLLWNAGASIMQGFLDGLKSIWNNITSFVGNIAGWIADHKGPISYDRRLLVPAGEAIMGGFRKSLNAGWSRVQSDIGGMNTALGTAIRTPRITPTAGITPAASAGGSRVTITNYYPQADPWPLATNSSLDNMAYGL